MPDNFETAFNVHLTLFNIIWKALLVVRVEQ